MTSSASIRRMAMASAVTAGLTTASALTLAQTHGMPERSRSPSTGGPPTRSAIGC